MKPINFLIALIIFSFSTGCSFEEPLATKKTCATCPKTKSDAGVAKTDSKTPTTDSGISKPDSEKINPFVVIEIDAESNSWYSTKACLVRVLNGASECNVSEEETCKQSPAKFILSKTEACEKDAVVELRAWLNYGLGILYGCPPYKVYLNELTVKINGKMVHGKTPQGAVWLPTVQHSWICYNNKSSLLLSKSLLGCK